MSTKVQLIGGAFQDAEGNLLANGSLRMRLNQDEAVNSTTQICSGVDIIIQLDSDGNVASSTSTPTAPNQYVWGNDQLSPVNSFYRVTGYAANGQTAWGPNNQQVIGSGGTFDVGTWVPNLVIDWTPPPQPINLEVNGSELSSQTLLDFVDSSSIVWTDEGAGHLSAAVAGGLQFLPSPDLKRYAMWEAATGQAPFATVFGTNPWTVTNDVQASTDGGASQSQFPADSSRNQACGFNCDLNQWREYLGQQVFWPGRNNRTLSRLEFNYDNTASNGKCYFGLCDLNFLGVGSDPTPGNFIGFAGDYPLSDTNPVYYSCQVYVGGTQTFVQATSSAIAAGSAYDFQVQINGSTVTFYINGTQVASTTVSLPTTSLGLYLGIKSRGGALASVRIVPEFMYNEVANVQ